MLTPKNIFRQAFAMRLIDEAGTLLVASDYKDTVTDNCLAGQLSETLNFIVNDHYPAAANIDLKFQNLE